MRVSFDAAITDEHALRSLYRHVSRVARDKEIDHLDDGARDFLAATTFLVVATSGGHGTDASPRGGPAGFVTVLDDHRLAFGDLSGNNRVDSHTNLISQPEVGVLFVVPGMDETLRVNGRATLTTDPAVLDATTVDGRRPHIAVGVDVERCYIHCGKALRRGGLWEPSTWLSAEARPRLRASSTTTSSSTSSPPSSRRAWRPTTRRRSGSRAGSASASAHPTPEVGAPDRANERGRSSSLSATPERDTADEEGRDRSGRLSPARRG